MQTPMGTAAIIRIACLFQRGMKLGFVLGDGPNSAILGAAAIVRNLGGTAVEFGGGAVTPLFWTTVAILRGFGAWLQSSACQVYSKSG